MSRTFVSILILLSLLGVMVVVSFPFDFTSRDYSNVLVRNVINDDSKLADMVRILGVRRTLVKMKAESSYAEDGQCHGAAHVIGRTALEVFGAEAFEQCDTTCFSGCYHGAMQRLAVKVGASELLSQVHYLCDARETRFEREQCFHGAGHGFLIHAHYNIVEAITACRALRTEEARIWCYPGVFMENLASDVDATEIVNSARFSEDDTHYPCSLFSSDEEVIQKSCYQLQPSYFLDLYKGDAVRASNECTHAPPFAQPDCYRRLGQLSGVDAGNPSRETEAYCATIPPEYAEDCILGGLRHAVVQEGINIDGHASAFCARLEIPENKRACYAKYSELIKDMYINRDTRYRLCSRIEETFVSQCNSVQ